MPMSVQPRPGQEETENTPENALALVRRNIDEIDDALLRLLCQRAQCAQTIGALKNGAIYRPEREAQVLRRILEGNPGPLPHETVRRIFREIMSACLALEQPLKIAYLGPAGTFTEAAALRHFGTAPCFLSASTIDDVFRMVESGHADYGVVPVENSTEGAVGRTLDLLLKSPLMICGEILLPVHQNLLAKPGMAMADLRTVYSHAQSFAQCHEWLGRHLPGIRCDTVSSNAEAARLAATQDYAGALAGETAAQHYGLTVLAASIEDEPDNTTRFIVLAAHDAGISGDDRTSLVCSAHNHAGAVHDLLTPFKTHGVSMTKLESRPARALGNSRWEYVFYIDVEGHRSGPALTRALDALQQQASYLKVLGSYPRCAAPPI
jgi:chorismate mutase/prephenate dehydratase